LTDYQKGRPDAASALQPRELEGKVAIITGGGGDIAQFYAKALCQAGAAVALVDINKQAAEAASAKLQESQFRVIGLGADVGNKAQVTACIEDAVARFGGLDILINNAGYATVTPFEDISEMEFDRVIDANLKGAFLMAQAATPHLKKRGRGKIVNLTSTVSRLGPGNLVHYVAAKTGVIGLTRALARALGPHNITVNAVAPGMVATAPIIAQYPKVVLDDQASRRSVPRWMYPEDLVGTLTYLCSSASDFMTGQTVMVDGGQVFD